MMAPRDPGGIALHPLTPTGDDLLLTTGAYVASDVGVAISVEPQARFRNSLLSGTGFFLLRASGRGTVACAAYGSIHKYTLKAGEKRSVDNGHLVAWSATMKYRVGLANPRGGIWTSMTSGEGLMCQFEGPGVIYLQSHKLGDAETVMKKGKSGASAVAQKGIAAYWILPVMMVCILFAKFVSLGGTANMFIRGNSNAYDSSYSSSPSHKKSNYQEYKTVGEF